MPIYPMACEGCGAKEEFVCGHEEYSKKIKNKKRCSVCGESLQADFSKEARNAFKPIIDFKPHYNYAVGEYVNTKKDMFNAAARKGVKLNRSY